MPTAAAKINWTASDIAITAGIAVVVLLVLNHLSGGLLSHQQHPYSIVG